MSDSENKTNELDETLVRIWDSLTEEQKEEARNCKTKEELLKLAGKYRIELSEEMLEQVAGGLIVRTGSVYHVMDDNDINIRYSCAYSPTDAAKKANLNNVSGKVISYDEYKARGGKKRLGALC